MDIRGTVYQGTFAWWLSQVGQFYRTNTLSELMKSDLAKYSNVTIRYGYDLKSFTYQTSPAYKILSVTIQKLTRSSNGYVSFTTGTETITGSVFVDASDDGKLTRMANFGGTAGRYDWPVARLSDTAETGSLPRAHQQAATLMFKIQGVNASTATDVEYNTRTNGKAETNVGGWGGVAAYKDLSAIKNFNNTYGPQGFALKPFNIAQDGTGQFWINTLLVFNVDGRAHERDYGTPLYPTDMMPGYQSVDKAWVAAKNFIKNNMSVTSDFMKALRSLPSLANATIVTSGGEPVVASSMYIRETIHSAGYLANANGMENNNFALPAIACHQAGTTASTGSDVSYKATAIGLLHYWSDINAYKFDDMKSGSAFIWGHEVAQKLRGDMTPAFTKDSPLNPVYAPYKMLTNDYVANLLVPGYATGCGAFAWSEVRVLPNLAVLGDAAGVAAAHAATNNINPLNFSTTDIQTVQTKLRNLGAKLDK